jgi:ribonuclease VapC
MFVDASAVIAILTAEPDAESLAMALDRHRRPVPIISVIAVWEAAAGLYRKKRIPIDVAELRIEEFLDAAGVKVVAVSEEDRKLALRAFDRYGRHRYSDRERNKALNLADCFHYAVAKANRVPILTKDEGFSLTDLAIVKA